MQEPAKKSFKPSSFLITGLLVAVAVVGFFGGVLYQKNQQTTLTTTGSTGSDGSQPTSTGQMGSGGRYLGRFEGGQVTAVSSTSITITTRTGSSKTYSITSNTQIVKQGQTATASDITVGDNVAIIPNTSNSSEASRIMLGTMFHAMDNNSGTSTDTQSN